MFSSDNEISLKPKANSLPGVTVTGGLSAYQLGQKVGTENVALTAAQMPSHGHLVNAVNEPGNTNIPARNTLLSGVGR